MAVPLTAPAWITLDTRDLCAEHTGRDCQCCYDSTHINLSFSC
jgi:hypothetical protein